MIVYRPFQVADFSSLKKLYKKTFNIDVSIDWYNHLYKNENQYSSFIADIGGEIIAHNALIDREYIFKKIVKKNISLSSGGMVNENYSGVFYTLLKKQIANFKGDSIIAFPNKNSAPFFEKIFKFNTIKRNYFTLNKSDFSPSGDSLQLNYKRNNTFIKKRIDKHINHKYFTIKQEGNYFIYKKYLQSIDIIFCSSFGVFFEEQIKNLIMQGHSQFNIVHWDERYIKRLGFKYNDNNIFVFKNFDNSNIVFECQMIDSDVF